MQITWPPSAGILREKAYTLQSALLATMEMYALQSSLTKSPELVLIDHWSAGLNPVGEWLMGSKSPGIARGVLLYLPISCWIATCQLHQLICLD